MLSDSVKSPVKCASNDAYLSGDIKLKHFFCFFTFGSNEVIFKVDFGFWSVWKYYEKSANINSESLKGIGDGGASLEYHSELDLSQFFDVKNLIFCKQNY